MADSWRGLTKLGILAFILSDDSDSDALSTKPDDHSIVLTIGRLQSEEVEL